MSISVNITIWSCTNGTFLRDIQEFNRQLMELEGVDHQKKKQHAQHDGRIPVAYAITVSSCQWSMNKQNGLEGME